MTSWQDAAACAGTDVHLWFKPDHQHLDATRERRAKAVCRGCPVVAACLEFAFETDDRFAVLAGLNPDERKPMRDRWLRQKRRRRSV